MQETRITLEISGIERVKNLIRTAYAQMHELECTVDRIKTETLEIQAKINQPSNTADD